MGAMNSGVAKAIREKWPVVYNKYSELCESWNAWAQALYSDENPDLCVARALLGKTQMVQVEDNKAVINLFGQGSFGYDGKRYTSYDAFWLCLGEIREIVPIENTIAFPKYIGCCRGGANWSVIETMIAEALHDYEIYIYELEEGK
jgi:O-acetyl-ADP-ribose deacetylase (regulator of RNase III)